MVWDSVPVCSFDDMNGFQMHFTLQDNSFWFMTSRLFADPFGPFIDRLAYKVLNHQSLDPFNSKEVCNTAVTF